MDRPIRVVLFGGGPVLEHAARRFIATLDEHPDVEFLGAYCQSAGQGLVSIVQDLWRRRGLLAIPLFFAWMGKGLTRLAFHPVREWRLYRSLRGLNHPVRYVKDLHAPDVLTHIAASNPDLGLIYGSPILRPELFGIPEYGTLGIHHGSLPRYRGKKTTFWEMYEGETEAGVTIQSVNQGLDTGAIVLEGRVPIGSKSRSGVWRELEDLGLALYLRAILAVRDGSAQYRPQEGPKGPLYSDPSASLVFRLWWRQSCKRWKGQKKRGSSRMDNVKSPDLSQAGSGSRHDSGSGTEFRVRPWSAAEMEEMGDLWADLVSRSNADPLFMSREWHSSWWDVFGSRSGAQWSGILAEDTDGNPRAISPLFQRKVRLKGVLPVTRLEPLGGFWNGPSSVLTQYSQPLGDFDSSPALMTSMLDHLEQQPTWSELIFPSIPSGGVCRSHLEKEAMVRGWTVRTIPIWPSRIVRLDEGFEAYLEQLSYKTRLRLYHHRKKLNQLGDVRFQHVPYEEADRYLDMMNRLRSRHRGNVALNVQALEFHRTLLARLNPRGELRLSVLSLNGNPISVNYALRMGIREYGVQMGFDASASPQLSLGVLHLGYALEAAAQDGMVSYDLMGGPGKGAGWKGSVANGQAEMVALQILRGRLLPVLYGLNDRLRRGRGP